jgi:hypothetical protein
MIPSELVWRAVCVLVISVELLLIRFLVFVIRLTA